MIPFHFGDNDRAKYGIFHPALGDGRAGRGVVLCNSYGDEAIRSHRVLRHTAETMTHNRWNVLRFDYYGSGDSSGAHQSLMPEQSVSDIEDAIRELETVADLGGVFLLGLRLGGTLAMRAATRRADVRGVILWDPIVDGAGFVAELKEKNSEGDGPFSTEGFVFSEALQESLSRLDLAKDLASFNGPVLLVSSSCSEPHRCIAAEFPMVVDYREIKAFPIWAKEEEGGLLPMPRELIQEIAAWEA